MNKQTLLAAVVLLCVVSAVSYYVGKAEGNTQHSKDYEAACLQADFIRYLIDHFDGETECANIGVEIENSYEEYFQDMYIYKTKHITSIEDFDDYSWCY